MFKKILIANRGEIACRVAKTSKRLGVETVGVYSEADKFSKHTQVMDEAYLLGPPKPQDSYLLQDKLINLALKTGAEAVHPGYGFLSENAGFVKKLEEAKLTFVGPPASAITKMGSKAESKHIMGAANVPIVPGYHGDNQDPKFLLEECKKIGFPVLLKASLGGGGKGMKLVRHEGEFQMQLEAAKREAMKGFSDDHMIIEKFVQKPRHIEVQVFGDKHGNYAHLNERDCSVQRRHQKVIEEAPSQIDQALRNEIGQAAVQAARAVGYWNAGTVEFIFDTTDNKFYFMEMNTRLQVEHPVTEMITGQDLVEWQLKIAAGFQIPLKQEQIPLHGHAVECRIYAEDPENGFLPGSGKITHLKEPTQINGVRIDTGIRQGDEISTFYDPMISKLIVWAEDREKAVAATHEALKNYEILGLKTNIKFLKRVLLNETFQTGVFDTSFIEQNEQELIGTPTASQEQVLRENLSVLLMHVWNENEKLRVARKSNIDPWKSSDNFRINHKQVREIALLPDEESKEETNCQIEYLSETSFNIHIGDQKVENVQFYQNPENEKEFIIKLENEQFKVPYITQKGNPVVLSKEGVPVKTLIKPEQDFSQAAEGVGSMDSFIKSPIPGTVVKLYCKPGQVVKKDEPLISIESMKLEHLIVAQRDVTVKEVRANEKAFVEMGAKLIIFEEEQESKE